MRDDRPDPSTDPTAHRLRRYFEAESALSRATATSIVEAARTRRRRPRTLRFATVGGGIAILAALAIALAVLPFRNSPAAPPPSSSSLPSASPIIKSTETPTVAPGEGGNITNAGITASGAYWVVINGYLEVSSNQGASWTVGSIQLPAPLSIDPAIFVLDARHAWSLTATAGSVDGGQGPPYDQVHLLMNRTSDAGTSWQQSAVPGDFPDARRSLYFLDAEHGFLMESGSDGNPVASVILRTDDGGATWTTVATVPASKMGGATLGSQIVASDSNTIWAAAEGEARGFNHPILAVSRDGGRTWSSVALPGAIDRWGGTQNIPFGPPTFVSQSIGFFCLEYLGDLSGSFSTLLFETTDAGRTWTSVAVPGDLASISFADASHWLVVKSGLPASLQSTSDGGQTWQQLPAVGLADGTLTDVTMHDADRGLGVFLAGGNSGPGILMLTTDGGNSWKPAIDYVKAPASPMP